MSNTSPYDDRVKKLIKGRPNLKADNLEDMVPELIFADHYVARTINALIDYLPRIIGDARAFRRNGNRNH